MPEAGERELARPEAATDFIAGLDDEDRQPVPCSDDRGGETIGSRTDNDDVPVRAHAQNLPGEGAAAGFHAPAFNGSALWGPDGEQPLEIWRKCFWPKAFRAND